MADNNVYTIPQLVKMHYPAKPLREIARSADLYRCGFKSGRVAYFHLEELKKELARREKAK